ncbi:hypothetical protein KAR26_02810 [Candidatus Parcubacteria bacterium]|nr:hypothetical protein [Candidatus Parcubacteria bacterium]
MVTGITIAYFSDTESNTGNLFETGTIDIHIEGDNFTWTEYAVLDDMKPCYTDYINFTIYNDGSDPNPVNVWKHINVTAELDGVTSEPECTEQYGIWTEGTQGNPGTCEWNSHQNKNDISTIIDYDMIVRVYTPGGTLLWWQTIYDKDVTIAQIHSNQIYLGMIPVDGYMKVTQSYHMQDPDHSTNWAQGDTMAFDIEVTGIQLRGEAWLDFKQAKKDGEDYYKVKNPGNPAGTLTYKVKNPEFDYEFTASGLQPNIEYDLIYYADPWPGNNPGALLGVDTANAAGQITMADSVELNSDLPAAGDVNAPHGAKIWLVPSSDYDETNLKMEKWNPDNYLMEVGLIYYYDTDF